MIWAADDLDPFASDEIRAEMAGRDPDEIEPPENQRLDEVLEYYDCQELLPFVYRLNWLHSVKEALGVIPKSFKVSYDEIQGLVVLNEEINRKGRADTHKMKKEQDRANNAAEVAKFARNK